MSMLMEFSSRAQTWLHRFRGGERGATATEYSILVGFIALVIVAGVGLFGLSLNGVFTHLTTGVKTALGLP